MTIQILGTGCAKCQALTRNAEAAAKSLGIDCTIEKITDINQILAYKVMMTPALAVDGTVRSAGRVLTPAEIADLLAAV